jgi:hypothetical protein
MRHTNNRLSILTYGYNDVIYDSQLEAAVSQNLKDSVRYRGGSTRDQLVIVAGEAVLRPKNPSFRKIQCIDKKGKVFYTIPDFELVQRADIFIEAKGNLDHRSRRNIEGLLTLGYKIAIVFVSESASKQPLWKGANNTKGDWLRTRGIPYVFGADKATELLEQLLEEDAFNGQ